MNSLKDTIDVVYATDKKYLPICCTSIVSLLSNNQGFEKISIHILTLDLGQAEIEKIKELENGFLNVSFSFYHLNSIIEKYKIQNRGYSLAGYLRIFIKSALPEELKKILYLDGDTLIVGDLSELWNSDLEGKICGGVLDPVTLDAKTRIGLRESNNYFNAGVMLIDLEKWRNEDIEKRLVNFLDMEKGDVFHHDQGLLNTVIREWRELSVKFNVMPPYMFFKRWQLIYLYKNHQISSKEEIRDAKECPVIIHDKLWASFWLHPYTKDFWKYNKINPFGKPVDRIKISQKINNWLQHFMPFFLYAVLWQWQWKRKISKRGQI